MKLLFAGKGIFDIFPFRLSRRSD